MLRPAEVGKGRRQVQSGLKALGDDVLPTPELVYMEAVKAPGRRCTPVDGRGWGGGEAESPKPTSCTACSPQPITAYAKMVCGESRHVTSCDVGRAGGVADTMRDMCEREPAKLEHAPHVKLLSPSLKKPFPFL